MSIRDDFFNALANGAKWDVGVSIDRSNPLPLDSRSVFKSLTDAQTYAEGVFSYPGQVIAVVSEDNKATVYVLDGNKTLQEIGSGSGSAMLFVSTVSALTTPGTPPTGVPNDLTVGQQAFVTEDKKIHFLTSIGTEGDVSSYVWEAQASDAPTWNGSATDIVGFEVNDTLAAYQGLTSKDDNVLYFIKDVGKIYRGSTDVTNSFIKVDSFPTAANAADGVFYIGPAPTNDTAGYEIKIKSNGALEPVIPGYYTDGANWAGADSGKLATIGLIKNGISEAINAIALATTFNKSTGTVKVGNGEGAILEGVAHGITYDSANLVITVPQYKSDGSSETLTINIPKDKFVTAGQYYEDYPDAATATHHKVIVLTIDNQDEPVIIPAESLVNIYTADNTDKNVKITVTEDNKISAMITLDPDANNALKYDDTKGFIVNISGKLDKVIDAVENNLVSFGADGSVKDSGKKIGGDTLSTDANTVATEAAVVSALSWTQLAEG